MISVLILCNVAVGWDTDVTQCFNIRKGIIKGNVSKSKYTTKASFLPEIQRYKLIHEMQLILHEIN